MKSIIAQESAFVGRRILYEYWFAFSSGLGYEEAAGILASEYKPVI